MNLYSMLTSTLLLGQFNITHLIVLIFIILFYLILLILLIYILYLQSIIDINQTQTITVESSRTVGDQISNSKVHHTEGRKAVCNSEEIFAENKAVCFQQVADSSDFSRALTDQLPVWPEQGFEIVVSFAASGTGVSLD